MNTISTEEVRRQWSYSKDPGPENRTTEEWWQIRDEACAEFDRWLDEVKAEAIVNYLRERADELGPHSLYSKWDIHTMIRNRLQELRQQEEA